jgi:hypothetical protein
MEVVRLGRVGLMEEALEVGRIVWGIFCRSGDVLEIQRLF